MDTEFWWRKVKERDRMKDEQIKSHERCKRTDPSVANLYTRQRLVFMFTLRVLYSPWENPVTQSVRRFKFQYGTSGS